MGLIGAPTGTVLALTCEAPLLDRWGHRAALLTGIPLVARVLLMVLLAGCQLASYSPDPYLSPDGFAVMGMGTSAIFPLAMSAAA